LSLSLYKITLKELDLEYEEVLIDLQGPRPAWYLELNPRGLVPTLHFQAEGVDEYLVESGLIVEFLTGLYPSHLTPHGGNPVADAAQRWRQRFFTDTWFGKVNPLLFKMTGTSDEAARLSIANDITEQIGKEIEPLLANAGPYFGGSSVITVVEVVPKVPAGVRC